MASLEETKSADSLHSMAKFSQNRSKPAYIPPTLKERYICLGGCFTAFIIALLLWSISGSSFGRSFRPKKVIEEDYYPPKVNPPAYNLRHDPPEKTFYDDPKLGYSLESHVTNWNEKRREWLRLHPSFLPGTRERIVMVTGSQPKPCKSPIGDHLLLRLFKNKVDYCRIHGYDIFYENLLIHPKMKGYWAKYAAVKAAMLAHPEAEWIWWVDSDAVFTDMEFKLPLERYRGFNLVVHGWRSSIMRDRSWTGLNAGVLLIRNCQWSLDFMEKWIDMGPIGKGYRKWGDTQRSIFKDKMFPESDDQTALIYLLYKDPSLMEDTVYLEGEYYLEAYWLQQIRKYENITARYEAIERVDRTLRRRRAEKSAEILGTLREPYVKKGGVVDGNWMRPFVTHFTGCQPCSGDFNPSYKERNCDGGMTRALNFADDQVMRMYGFKIPNLADSETVVEVPFDYPKESSF